MTAFIKICGLSTPATLEAALEAGANMVGFVFFPKSPRHVDAETARAPRRAGARTRVDRRFERRRPTTTRSRGSSNGFRPISCNCMDAKRRRG